VINFDPDTHTYSVDGTPYSSVTQVIGEAGLYGDSARWFDDYSANRGRIVHKLIELYYKGTLDETSIDPALKGYFDAYLKFADETEFFPGYVEEVFYHVETKIAGKPDLIGNINSNSAILDIKTGSPNPATAIQLAGYEYIYKSDKPCQRFAVHLKEDGKYSLIQYRDRRDRDVFIAAVTLHNWRKANLKGG